MWTEGNYRRVFLDMHIDDWNEEFLSKLDPEKIVETIKESGTQMIVAKCRPHTGLANFPTKYGRQHRGLKGRDYVGEMVRLCHENGIAVKGYFSQIFDNYSYDHHPDWRFVDAHGNTSRDRHKDSGWMPRYGVLCPNNEDYREFCRNAVTEIVSKYDLDSIFLDMPFQTDICYCGTCRKKYFDLTGRELPKTIDFRTPEMRNFQDIREGWMAEFAEMMRKAVKAANPSVTIEQNMACLTSPWKTATTDAVADTSDYTGGDLYGGYLEESFICKYYRNVTKSLPFVFICSRCDPNLQYHTSTKTYEEFVQHGIIALVHNGALSICDGMNPDGTINGDPYRKGGVIQRAFEATRPYEKYVSGNYKANISLWFNSKSKYDIDTPSNPLAGESVKYLNNLKAVADILRMENIPYDVIPTKKLGEIKTDALVISGMVNVSDGEAEKIAEYVKNGGNLYLGGRVENPILLDLIGVRIKGETEHRQTYFSPTVAGKEFFAGYTADNPLAVESPQFLCDTAEDVEILATTVLPYTTPSDSRFAAIHSNPPGIRTSNPALIRRKAGKGTVIWSNAPIEGSKPYMNRKTVGNLLRSICGAPAFESNAPYSSEVMLWEKDGKEYISVVNQQETVPLNPIYNISITLPYEVKSAAEPVTGEKFEVKPSENGSTVIIDKVGIFRIVQIEKA